MKDILFYIIVVILCLVGIITTSCLVKYTLDLKENLSITSYISNEE